VKQELHQPPREFSPYPGLKLSDMGDVWLASDEQLTFRMPTGAGNDIVRKDWGFYLTNSLNVNLRSQGFKTALVSSGATDPRFYVLLVDAGKLDAFDAYLKEFGMKLAAWLDEWPVGHQGSGLDAPA
jgi:hypothetical protein